MNTPSTKPTTELTPEEREYLKLKYEHLLMLLQASALPDEAKAAWVQIIPEMNIDQLNRLIKILEDEMSAALSAMQQSPDEQRLIDKLNEARDFHEEELSSIAKRTEAALQALDDELPSV